MFLNVALGCELCDTDACNVVVGLELLLERGGENCNGAFSCADRNF